jgi:hypothetical protein
MKPTATNVNKTQWCFAWPAARKSVGGKDKAALVKGSKWDAGDVITISFSTATRAYSRRSRMRRWRDRSATCPAEIRVPQEHHRNAGRISFRYAGSWSVIGTTCKQITDMTQPTMNFGWLTPDSSDEDVRSVCPRVRPRAWPHT